MPLSWVQSLADRIRSLISTHRVLKTRVYQRFKPKASPSSLLPGGASEPNAIRLSRKSTEQATAMTLEQRSQAWHRRGTNIMDSIDVSMLRDGSHTSLFFYCPLTRIMKHCQYMSHGRRFKMFNARFENPNATSPETSADNCSFL
jgi:hypothetical protein